MDLPFFLIELFKLAKNNEEILPLKTAIFMLNTKKGSKK